MREIGIERFKRAMAEEICDLPVAVTRRGKIIFKVIEPHGSISTNKQETPNHMVQPHGSEIPSKKSANHMVQPHGSGDKPRLPSSRKQIIKKLKAVENDEFNPLKDKPFRAQTHHREDTG